MNDETIKPKLIDIVSDAQLAAGFKGTPMAVHVEALTALLSEHEIEHGFYPKWRDAVKALPSVVAEPACNDEDHWFINLPNLSKEHTTQLESALKDLMPWRKGPFKLGPITIDTEWRSNWKWNRLIEHIAPLAGRDVLDVGCGNGYHLWRMHEAGAQLVLGIEPSPLFNCQFNAIQRYANIPSVIMLPLTFEQFPASQVFDSVFSMGVLYHRRAPAEHLQELRDALKPGGEIILETLIAPGEDDSEIQIEDRYANMRNLYQLPSVLRVARWMEEASFSNIRCISVDVTSPFEQRTTQWMPYHSLSNALDPDNKLLTIEGLPRPRRAILIANR
ncbi:MAG: tRNA 5-methoxyuridine(34)/uridine 5-oxyacetic acid(34) synthase CmoB [Granulosicoccaceae bacterium]